MATLSLVLRCDKTQWGETVGVLGSWCDWNENAPTPMTTTGDTFPSWRGVILLPDKHCGGEVQYKYVIVKDGRVARWEPGNNRRVNAPPPGAAKAYDDGVFGDGGKSRSTKILPDARECVRAVPTASGYKLGDEPPAAFASPSPLSELPALERVLVRVTGEQRSWRQRLQFVRDLLNGDVKEDDKELCEARVDASQVGGLAVIAAYLSFLTAGQLICAEDGGHHRPNHLAGAARAIEHALTTCARDGYAPFVARRIFPHLPSYASQFTCSVPLTRIRDIAHRNDIPHDLKQEIKHTLQNKLHRCAGPEDMETCKRILEKVSHGGYSEAFVHELRIFHGELEEFFNAASLDDRIDSLVRAHSGLRRPVMHLKRLKAASAVYSEILSAVTMLRAAISQLPDMRTPRNASALPTEEAQRLRLADIALEEYAFSLLSQAARQVEDDLAQGAQGRLLGAHFDALAVAFQNIALSDVRPDEANAIANEIRALDAVDAAASVLARRAKAAVDRAAAFAADFASAVAKLYGERVVAFAAALGVEARAAAVFAEAEIRANIAFQASRIADAGARACRRILALPPWDPLLVGSACGKVVFVDTLHDAHMNAVDGRVVVVSRGASGEEDLPANVCGVILGRPLPHLSHLGVRARQAKVVFVCAEENDAFEKIWRERYEYATMQVDAFRGLEWGRAEEVEMNGVNGARASIGKVANGHNVRLEDLELDGCEVVSMEDTTKMNGSSKCAFVAKMMQLAKKSDGLFSVPQAMCVTHAAFAKQSGSVQEQLDEEVRKYETVWSAEARDVDEVEETARAVRKVIEEFEFGGEAIIEIQKAFASGGATRVMVRSSANAEDLESMSGAGLYDSIANVEVTDAAALKKAIVRVWGSVWTSRAASSRAMYGVAHNAVSMAVLVQLMVRASLSFVAFSRDPVHADTDDNSVYIEVAVGMGETLASGASRGAPYRLSVKRGSMRVTTIAFASISEQLTAFDEDDGMLRSGVVDYSTQRMTTNDRLRNKVATKIAKTVIMLESKLGGAQDVEGAITLDDEHIEVFVVQARPQIV